MLNFPSLDIVFYMYSNFHFTHPINFWGGFGVSFQSLYERRRKISASGALVFPQTDVDTAENCLPQACVSFSTCQNPVTSFNCNIFTLQKRHHGAPLPYNTIKIGLPYQISWGAVKCSLKEWIPALILWEKQHTVSLIPSMLRKLNRLFTSSKNISRYIMDVISFFIPWVLLFWIKS